MQRAFPPTTSHPASLGPTHSQVGYAFINFIEPNSIALFYQDFNQRKWDRFNSEKVCRLAYARIQGKTAFIEHFRNSSLMYEDETCRPLIFHSTGPLKGLLQPFPEPTVPRVQAEPLPDADADSDDARSTSPVENFASSSTL